LPGTSLAGGRFVRGEGGTMSKWMPNCREISRIVSESFDRRLPLRRRMAMWMHLLMCGHCSRFRKELSAIRRAAREGADPMEAEPAIRLSESTRSRIRKMLEQAAENSR
jgi:hypothetical protein